MTPRPGPPSARGPAHLPWLDGWRGAAVAAVLIQHFGGPYFLGRFGVDAFFVLSGLLISMMLYDRKQALRTFFIRRAARILPVFVTYVGCVYVVYGLAGWPPSTSEVISTLTFLRTYWVTETSHWQHDTYPLAHIWSLNVEEHSYLLMALVAVSLRRRRRAAGWFLLACAMVCGGFYARYRFHAPDSPMPYTARTECAGFPIFLSASLYLLCEEYRLKVPVWASLAALAAAIGAGALWGHMMSVYLVVVPALLAVSINGLMRASRTAEAPSIAHQHLFGNGLLRTLGVASFSIYLWQQPAHIHYIRGQLPGPALLWLALSTALGYAVYRGLEQPVRRKLVSRFAPG